MNRVVPGLPLSGTRVTADSHWHVWTIAGDGYVEPVGPPVREPEQAIAYFCDRVNLWLNGPFKHPMYGLTPELI